jgi:hypothetical protein
MSRFYVSTHGDQRAEVTRGGHRTITAHVRGWDSGIRVEGYIDGAGNDVFEVYRTGGSNDPTGAERLARIVNDVRADIAEAVTEEA